MFCLLKKALELGYEIVEEGAQYLGRRLSCFVFEPNILTHTTQNIEVIVGVLLNVGHCLLEFRNHGGLFGRGSGGLVINRIEQLDGEESHVAHFRYPWLNV